MGINRMVEIREFKGTLKVLGSGLRIGGNKESAGVGELDSPIIRHPISNQPYVPGSSVKGKIRSLLEQKYGLYQSGGMPCDCGRCFICELFGCHNSKNTISPVRLAFHDCQPLDSTKKQWQEAGVDSEVKMEVTINRKNGVVGGGGPRSMERIPAFSDFDFSFSIRYFESIR